MKPVPELMPGPPARAMPGEREQCVWPGVQGHSQRSLGSNSGCLKTPKTERTVVAFSNDYRLCARLPTQKPEEDAGERSVLETQPQARDPQRLPLPLSLMLVGGLLDSSIACACLVVWVCSISGSVVARLR